MSFAARVASLHPLIITGIWLLPFAAMALPALTPLMSAWLLLWLVWTPCVYVTMRNALTPAPQKRYPLLAVTAFALAIGGQIIGQIVLVFRPFDGSAMPSPFDMAIGAAFGIGLLVSMWATADALVKAETGRVYLADPRSVGETVGHFMFTGVGVWFLHPRIKRALGAD